MTKMTSLTDAEEIIVFGKGVGESILFRIKGDKWIVIDSFIDPVSKNPIALEYLKYNGIDTQKIVGIVCTHWDDDHICGISDIIAQSEKQLPFVLPIPLNDERIQQYITYNTHNEESAICEFVKVMRQRQKNRCKFFWAHSERILFGEESVNSGITFKALSPNDRQYEAFLQSIILPEANQEKKKTFSNENKISTVVYAKTDDESFLIGGDLENSPIGGWQDICDHYYENIKSNIFKIPHHGSATAYCEDVWVKMVKTPISIVTRFNRSHLPKDDVLQTIVNNSGRTFVIGPAPKKDKLLMRKVSKYRSAIKDIKIFEPKYGYVRLYKNGTDSKWKEEIYGEVVVYDNGDNITDSSR